MQKYEYRLDILRALAILCVTMVHTVEKYFNDYLASNSTPDDFILVFWLSFYSIGRLGVPFFLIITGYFQLNKQYKDASDLLMFYKKSMLPLIKKCLLGYAFLIGFDLLKGIKYSIFEIGLQLLLIKDWPGVQTWYIPFIIGIYLLLPFMTSVMLLSDKAPKLSILILLVLIFYEFVLVDLNNVLEVVFNFSIKNTINFQFIQYFGVYLIVGYLFKKNILRKVPNFMLWIGSIIGIISLVFEQALFYQLGSSRLVWYNSGLILLTSVCMAEMIIHRDITVRYQSLIRMIAKVSFILFWVHSVVQEFTFQYVKSRLNGSVLWEYLFFFLLTFIISIIVSLIFYYSKVFIIRLWRMR